MEKAVVGDGGAKVCMAGTNPGGAELSCSVDLRKDRPRGSWALEAGQTRSQSQPELSPEGHLLSDPPGRGSLDTLPLGSQFPALEHLP